MMSDNKTLKNQGHLRPHATGAVPEEPHLTPRKLVGQRFRPEDVLTSRPARKVALMGFCPPPQILDRYWPQPAPQWFIHLPAASTKVCMHQGIEFLSLEHVYGGPVAASTVEELAFYEFDAIFAYGLAGGLGTKGLKMGDFYVIEKALVRDGTSPHYTQDPWAHADGELLRCVGEWMRTAPVPAMKRTAFVNAVTGDAIYRETDEYLRSAKSEGCDVVNLDTSHLYAVSRHNHEGRTIRTIEMGVLSDVATERESESSHAEWDSRLSEVLSGDGGSDGPLALTGSLVEFLVETALPRFILEPLPSRVGG